jgi:hypothetical protein
LILLVESERLEAMNLPADAWVAVARPEAARLLTRIDL